MDIFKIHGRGWHWAVGIACALVVIVVFSPLVALLALTRCACRGSSQLRCCS